MSNPLRQYVCITEPIPVIGTNIFFNSCCEPKFCPHLSHGNVVSLFVELWSNFFSTIYFEFVYSMYWTTNHIKI